MSIRSARRIAQAMPLLKTSLCSATAALMMAAPAIASDLTVSVTNPDAKGRLVAVVFRDKAAFSSEVPNAIGTAAPAGAGTRITVGNMPKGGYGVVVFQDVNGNERLDRNALGVPTEPFGFSNNPKIGMRAPSFASFAVAPGTRSLKVTLNK